MALSVEEGKARRLAGLKREASELTVVERIQRFYVSGRPQASEFRTALAAVHAARVLHRELGLRMNADGVHSKPGDWAVSVGYVTPDLSTVGFTPLYAPNEENNMSAFLTGNIALGLIFGLVDRGHAKPRLVMGVRPFFTTKQTEGWLSELEDLVHAVLIAAALDGVMLGVAQ